MNKNKNAGASYKKRIASRDHFIRVYLIIIAEISE
jgi:hypothetical protein